MFCVVLNCVRLLTRILAYIFEDPDWRGFFWSTLPRQTADESVEVVVTTVRSCYDFMLYLSLDISPLESLLSRSVHTALAQLCSGHCRLLNSYKARITSGISDVEWHHTP